VKYILWAVIISILVSVSCQANTIRVLYDSPYNQKELYKIADFIEFRILEIKVASPEGYWIKIQIKHACGVVDFAWNGVPKECWIYVKGGD